MNSNTDRWLLSSIAKHFSAIAQGNIEFLLEDEQRNTEGLNEWVELRVNGPEYKEFDKDCYMVSVEVDLLITVRMTKTNIYRIHELCGLFESTCDNIPIYKFGNGGSFVFCLPLDQNMVSNIRKLYYGKVEATQLQRASVSAFYETLTVL